MPPVRRWISAGPIRSQHKELPAALALAVNVHGEGGIAKLVHHTSGFLDLVFAEAGPGVRDRDDRQVRLAFGGKEVAFIGLAIHGIVDCAHNEILSV